MPFGLHRVAATFQCLVHKDFKNCQEFARAYLDDIILSSPDWPTHLKHLRAVFQDLQEAGLKANPKKSKIGFQELRFPGQERKDPPTSGEGDYPGTNTPSRNKETTTPVPGAHRLLYPLCAQFCNHSKPTNRLSERAKAPYYPLGRKRAACLRHSPGEPEQPTFFVQSRFLKALRATIGPLRCGI